MSVIIDVAGKRYIYYRLRRVERTENIPNAMNASSGLIFTTKHRWTDVKISMVEEKSVWKERRNICKISQDFFPPPVLFNYSIIKELFLLKCLNYFQKIIFSLFNERELERKARERLFLDARKWDIKLNTTNTMCFNKINFYQLHGKLIPTVFNKNPKFTREDVNRNNDESEARDYEIMSD